MYYEKQVFFVFFYLKISPCQSVKIWHLFLTFSYQHRDTETQSLFLILCLYYKHLKTYFLCVSEPLCLYLFFQHRDTKTQSFFYLVLLQILKGLFPLCLCISVLDNYINKKETQRSPSAVRTGLEPVTSCVTGRHSNQAELTHLGSFAVAKV